MARANVIAPPPRAAQVCCLPQIPPHPLIEIVSSISFSLHQGHSSGQPLYYLYFEPIPLVVSPLLHPPIK